MGRKAENLTGKKFNYLTVIRRATEDEYARGAGKHAMWLCKCDCGNLTTVRACYLLSGHTRSCGCNRQWGKGHTSKGEEKIISILKENNIKFEREKTFSDMKKYGNPLRLDFYIPNEKIALEFNGECHYKKIDFFHKNLQEFKKRQEYDRYKIKYCLTHNIKLYCIPYWELDNLNTLKDLFNPNFIAYSQWKNDQDWTEYKKNI